MEMVSGLQRQTRSHLRPRIVLIVVLAVVVPAVLFSLSRFTDPAWIYDFADRRQILGVPNFMDVVSNAPWLLIGLLGLLFVARTRAGPDSPFAERWERMAFAVLFAGVLTVAFGSAYFHLAPAVATLVWDRLPMTIIFDSSEEFMGSRRLGQMAK